MTLTGKTNADIADLAGPLVPLYFAAVAVLVLLLIFLLIRLLRTRRAENRARQASREDRQRRQLVVMNHLRDRGRRSFKQLLRATGMKPPQLVVALEYLTGRGLITQDKSLWKPSWMDDRVYAITAMGIDEVDNGRGNPRENTAHLGPQVLVTGGSVRDITVQGGSGDTQNTGKRASTLGGTGNVQDSPGATLSKSAALDFTDDFREFLREFGARDEAQVAAEKRLDLIESSLSSEANIKEIRTSGERALNIADGIAVSAAGRAAYEALEAVWARVIG